jgi:hypothetical protein
VVSPSDLVAAVSADAAAALAAYEQLGLLTS